MLPDRLFNIPDTAKTSGKGDEVALFDIHPGAVLRLHNYIALKKITGLRLGIIPVKPRDLLLPDRPGKDTKAIKLFTCG